MSKSEKPLSDILKESNKFLLASFDDYAEIKQSKVIGLRACRDLEVDSDSHLFVLASGLISHNSSKHEAGGFKGKKQTFSGFNYINQFLESPDQYKSRAPLAESDGKIERIYDAPQGGKYITVNGHDHYVNPDFMIDVKVGDEVEQGDQLADGLPDLDDIIRLRGLGEARKAFVNIGKQVIDDSGTPVHKRNMEVLARGIIDKIEITDPDGLGDYLPGDIGSYNKLEATYVPEKDSKSFSVTDKKHLKGKYLQKPILHYSIGTKLTNKMIDHIANTKITDSLLVSEKEPGFKPIFVRTREVPLKGNDAFLEKANAPYQARTFVESAIRGNKTNIKSNVDPFVRMSQPDFAEHVYETGKF